MGLRRRTPLMRPSVLAEGAEVMKVRHLAGLRPVRRSHKLPGPLGAASLPAGGPRPQCPGASPARHDSGSCHRVGGPERRRLGVEDWPRGTVARAGASSSVSYTHLTLPTKRIV